MVFWASEIMRQRYRTGSVKSTRHSSRGSRVNWLVRKGTETSGLPKAKKLEARGGIEPPIKVLQTFALPLGDRASEQSPFYQTVAPASHRLPRRAMPGSQA